MSYYTRCVGSEEYIPFMYGKHEGKHPKRVKETIKNLIGTEDCDVVVALVREIQALRNKQFEYEFGYLQKNSVEQQLINLGKEGKSGKN